MKIKLIKNLPIEPKHLCLAGKEYEVLSQKDPQSRGQPKGYWIQGAADEKCLAFETECEVVE
jgi:hypothetical protein